MLTDDETTDEEWVNSAKNYTEMRKESGHQLFITHGHATEKYGVLGRGKNLTFYNSYNAPNLYLNQQTGF